MTQSSELLASTPGAIPKLQFDLHEKLASPIPFPKPAFAGKKMINIGADFLIWRSRRE